MGPETKFKKNIVLPELNKIEKLWYFVTQEIATCGIPDIIICYKGKMIAWELKKDSKQKAKPLQLEVLREITYCRGIARVVNPDNFKESLEELKNL